MTRKLKSCIQQYATLATGTSIQTGLTLPRSRRVLLAMTHSYMLHTVKAANPEMFTLTNLEGSRCKRWSALVVLFAVCSLTVSVATRYTCSRETSENRVASVHKHTSPDLGRQRLIKDAACWMPPVVRSVVLQAPSSYPNIAPAGPPMPSALLEESLYNRPPPSSGFLS